MMLMLALMLIKRWRCQAMPAPRCQLAMRQRCGCQRGWLLFTLRRWPPLIFASADYYFALFGNIPTIAAPCRFDARPAPVRRRHATLPQIHFTLSRTLFVVRSAAC